MTAVAKNILIRCQKQEVGLLIHSRYEANALQGDLEVYGIRICRFCHQTDLHRNGNYALGGEKKEIIRKCIKS